VKIINRYIISSFLKVVSLCICSFVAIYLMIDFLDKFTRFSRAGGSIGAIGFYFLWEIPAIINQITPLAVLMATLLTLGMLSRNSEMTAMRGCGISLVRITAPLLAIALLISVFTLLTGEFVVPACNDRTRYIEDVQIRKKGPAAFFRQQNIWYRQENGILQAKSYDPNTATLKGVTFWQTGSGLAPSMRIEARQATLKDNRWVFGDAVIREFSEGNVAMTTTSAYLPVRLNLKVSDLKVLQKYADNMGFFELRRYCRKLERGGYDATRYIAQMHSRLSLPFASLVMAFLAIPFALRGGRTSGIALGVATSLAIGFTYFIVNAILLSFGQTGVLPPLIAAWSANLLFAAAGVWLAMTVNR